MADRTGRTLLAHHAGGALRTRGPRRASNALGTGRTLRTGRARGARITHGAHHSRVTLGTRSTLRTHSAVGASRAHRTGRTHGAHRAGSAIGALRTWGTHRVPGDRRFAAAAPAAEIGVDYPDLALAIDAGVDDTRGRGTGSHRSLQPWQGKRGRGREERHRGSDHQGPDQVSQHFCTLTGSGCWQALARRVNDTRGVAVVRPMSVWRRSGEGGSRAHDVGAEGKRPRLPVKPRNHSCMRRRICSLRPSRMSRSFFRASLKLR